MRDDELDRALEQTFPASDPPAFMAGLAIVGRPRPKSHHGSRGELSTEADIEGPARARTSTIDPSGRVCQNEIG